MKYCCDEWRDFDNEYGGLWMRRAFAKPALRDETWEIRNYEEFQFRDKWDFKYCPFCGTRLDYDKAQT